MTGLGLDLATSMHIRFHCSVEIQYIGNNCSLVFKIFIKLHNKVDFYNLKIVNIVPEYDSKLAS